MTRIRTIDASTIRALRPLNGWMCSSTSFPGPPRVHPRDREWWIYFIQGDDGGPIKIGCSRTPIWRLGELSIGYPFGRLGIAGLYRAPRREEKALHRRFADLRIRGEWFEPQAPLREFILSLPEPV